MAQSTDNEFCELDPSVLKDIVTNLDIPVVFKNYLSSPNSKNPYQWNCMKWNKDDWKKLFKNALLPVRFGLKLCPCNLEPQWESNCLKGQLTFDELLTWDDENISSTAFCGTKVNSKDYWAYYDYIYLKDCKNFQQLENDLSWKSFGFPNKGFAESVLWIGTSGAYTPCHQDTYGFNLVAQVSGTKKWVMFPKTESSNLYPTRIPYEESSIYSEINFPFVSFEKFSKISNTNPYIITLQPGDILLVPHHWWHFVQSQEFSISINTWIELPIDNTERFKENLSMYMIASTCQGVINADILSKIFNPNMLDLATYSSEDLLKQFIRNISENFMQIKMQDDLLELNQNILYCKKCKEHIYLTKKHNIIEVPFSPFKDNPMFNGGSCKLHNQRNIKECNKSTEVNSDVSFDILKIILDSFNDSRVLDSLSRVMIEKLKSIKESE